LFRAARPAQKPEIARGRRGLDAPSPQ